MKASYLNMYPAGPHTIDPEELKKIREKIKTLDEIELDKIIEHYKEYENKPLYYHRKNAKKDY
jgi:hypothetical protein